MTKTQISPRYKTRGRRWSLPGEDDRFGTPSQFDNLLIIGD
jgi:hypothetical protein